MIITSTTVQRVLCHEFTGEFEIFTTMNFSGIIFGAAKSVHEWKVIEPKSDEEFQIQHILNFMRDDAIMVKC